MRKNLQFFTNLLPCSQDRYDNFVNTPRIVYKFKHNQYRASTKIRCYEEAVFPMDSRLVFKCNYIGVLYMADTSKLIYISIKNQIERKEEKLR